MSVRLAAAVLLAAAPALAADRPQVELTWWGHAAWIVKTPKGTTIAIDPWLSNPNAPKGATRPEKLDAILISHAHSDHVGDTAALAKQTGAKVIASHELASLLGAKNAVGANIGGSVRVGDVTIHLVEAVHSSGFGEAPDLKYGGSPMGYVLEIDDGPTLYHAGDTGFFSSMALIKERYAPQIALLPIGGHYTMDPQGAALAVKLLGAKTVLPMHYGTFPLLAGTPAELKAALGSKAPFAKVVEATPGKPLRFGRE